jgi:ankyrin repeat protein
MFPTSENSQKRDACVTSGHRTWTRTITTQHNDIPEWDAGSHSGKTALHLATEHGHAQCAQALLHTSTADVNAKDGEGNTALHLSAYRGHLVIAQLLIRNGATMRMPNNLGYTPLHRAVERNCLAVVKLLIEHGIEINKRVEIPVL